MAVDTRPLSTSLQLRLDMGNDESGKKIIRSKSFNGVKSDISDQDIYDTAIGIASLQSHELVAVRKAASVEYVEVQ